MGWRVLVPVKGDGGKSRLEHPRRAQLAVAMSDDVVAVAAATDGVEDVVRVPAGPGGLSADVAGAATAAARERPGTRLAVLMGDLPALTPTSLGAALRAAAAHPGAVVADAAGEGTVLLTGRDGVLPAPAFGPGSRHRHVAAGAVDLTDTLGVTAVALRRDVDTVADLELAVALGVGPATAAVLDGHRTGAG